VARKTALDLYIIFAKKMLQSYSLITTHTHTHSHRDAVARKTALDLLVNYASRPDMVHRQFIFITPQDLSYVQSRVSNTFRIHKLLPPVRNHGTLQQQTIN
jgi:hypothetical protein